MVLCSGKKVKFLCCNRSCNATGFPVCHCHQMMGRRKDKVAKPEDRLRDWFLINSDLE